MAVKNWQSFPCSTVKQTVELHAMMRPNHNVLPVIQA